MKRAGRFRVSSWPPRIAAVVLAIGLSAAAGAAGAAALVPPPPMLLAASALLLDAESGELLFAKGAFERRPPGELTKILTALVVLTELDPVSSELGARGSGGARSGGARSGGVRAGGTPAGGGSGGPSAGGGSGDLSAGGGEGGSSADGSSGGPPAGGREGGSPAGDPEIGPKAGLGATVRISRAAANAAGYGLRLEEGDEFPAGDLLAAMYWHPGSDAAVALAEHVAGSVEGFAERMNAAASALGAGHSSFRNPHGADEPGHLSTAYDLALIAKAALEIPGFARLAAVRRAVLPWGGRLREFRNVNSFLWRYPGAAGVKSTYTPAGGYSVAAFAEREKARLLAVVLGAPSVKARWLDAASLLDYGFAHLAALKKEPQLEKERYVVQAGDTLSGLARRFGVPASAIRLLNRLDDPDELAVGSSLWIPR